MRLRHLATASLLLTLGVGSAPALADHQGSHGTPQGPAKVRFAPDFPELVDDEWGFQLAGFGGIERGAPMKHLPLIMVHGNNVDAADWYPVRDDFLAAGWTDQELWALSYNGLGGNNGTALQRTNPERDAEHSEMGWDGTTRVTANDINVPDLADFIAAVLDYTGAEGYHMVGHSLGVTLARKTLLVHPELAEPLVSFIGIAGANDGTSFCPPGSEGQVHSCDEIAAGTAWLDELNGPDGSLETYGDTKWLTIYDGTGAADPAYVGPTYAESPMLLGAENVAFPGVYHNDLRIREDIVEFYRLWVEGNEVVATPAPQEPAAPAVDAPAAAPAEVTAVVAADQDAIPATGAPLLALGLLALGSGCGGVALSRAGRRRR